MDNQSYRPTPIVTVDRGSSNRRKRLRSALLAVIAIALIGGGYALYLRQQNRILPAAPAPGAGMYKAAAYYCSLHGNAALCQDVESTSTSKYQLPAELGLITSIAANSDGSLFLVRSSPSPITRDTDKFYITDAALADKQLLPVQKGQTYSGAVWIGTQTVAYTARSDDGQTLTGLYDLETKQSRTLGKKTDGPIKIYPSADGKYLFSETMGAKTPKLSVTDITKDQSREVDTSPLAEHMKAYATSSYDQTSNIFYISGSSKKDNGRSVLVIAQVTENRGQLRLDVKASTKDSYAYLPLTAVKGGLLVSQQPKENGATEIGVVNTNGIFTASKLTHAGRSSFGTPTLPGVKAQADSQLTADDFWASFVSSKQTPATLQSFMRQLSSGKNCQQGVPAFNHVSLLGFDDTQAAINIQRCDGQPAAIHYYRSTTSSSSTTFEEIGVTSSGLPTCDTVSSLKLSEAVAPSCQVAE